MAPDTEKTTELVGYYHTPHERIEYRIEDGRGIVWNVHKRRHEARPMTPTQLRRAWARRERKLAEERVENERQKRVMELAGEGVGSLEAIQQARREIPMPDPAES